MINNILTFSSSPRRACPTLAGSTLTVRSGGRGALIYTLIKYMIYSTLHPPSPLEEGGLGDEVK